MSNIHWKAAGDKCCWNKKGGDDDDDFTTGGGIMILRLGTFDDVRGEEEPGIAGKPISRGDTCALAAVVFSGCERIPVRVSGTYGMYVSHMYVRFM